MGNPVTRGYQSSSDLHFTVDMNNLSRSITQWRHLEIAYDKGVRKGIEEVADRLKDKIIFNLGKYGLANSEIAHSISVVDNGKGISVIIGSDYAIYVEYGTGVVGKTGKQHPKLKLGWVYDEGDNGERGWFYPTTQSDPNPNKHTYKGQLYGWTKGEESRPFLYDSWRWARASFTQIISKNVKAEVKKVRGVR
jgi:hypothetical protein